MKLTKGKIRKLYNKKNQTFKKYKNKKASYERKTFRNKKSVNLARKTLKKVSGGADDQNPGFSFNRFKEGAKGAYNRLFGSKQKQPVVLDTGFNQMQPGANVENSNVQQDDSNVINPLQYNAPQNDIVQTQGNTVAYGPENDVVPENNIPLDLQESANSTDSYDTVISPLQSNASQNDIMPGQPIITNSENAIVGPNVEQTQGTENDAVVPGAKDKRRSKSASSYFSKGIRRFFRGKPQVENTTFNQMHPNANTAGEEELKKSDKQRELAERIAERKENINNLRSEWPDYGKEFKKLGEGVKDKYNKLFGDRQTNVLSTGINEIHTNVNNSNDQESANTSVEKTQDISTSNILDNSASQDPSGIVTSLDQTTVQNTTVQSGTQDGSDAPAIQVPLDPPGIVTKLDETAIQSGTQDGSDAPAAQVPSTSIQSSVTPQAVPSTSIQSSVTPQAQVPSTSIQPEVTPQVVPASVTSTPPVVPPASQQTPGNEIANSLTTVTNYFADIIANKITQKLPNPTYQGTYQDKLQDGFVAVSKAAETMAKSGNTSAASKENTTAASTENTTAATTGNTDISGNTSNASRGNTDISGNTTTASTSSSDISGNTPASTITTAASTGNTSTATTGDMSTTTSKPAPSKGGKIYRKTKRFRLTNNKTKNAR